MKEWLNSLKPRERQIVIAGGAITMVLLVYALIWAPYANGVTHLEQSVAEKKTLRLWMTQSAQEAQRLKGAGGGARATSSGRSLLAVVDQAAKDGGLGPAVKRIEPEGQDTVHVSLEQTAFDDLVRWLGTLEHVHGMRVENLSVDRLESPGLANARLTIKRAAS